MATAGLENIAQIFVTHIQDGQNLAQCSIPISPLAAPPIPHVISSAPNIFLILLYSASSNQEGINSFVKSLQTLQTMLCAPISHGISIYGTNAKIITYGIEGDISFSSK